VHILSIVEGGNRAGVPFANKDLLNRFGNATDPVQANSVAWSCAVVPVAVSDRAAPVRLAEVALAGCPEGQKCDVLNTLGAARNRSGRFEEAIRRLNESILVRGGGGTLKGFAFLAMAHHHLGHRDEAKRWLDKLAASQPKEVPEVSWEGVDIRILRREAESLILGSPPAARPSARAASSERATGHREA
jgi:hypothetical protein